jgi:hypothetical protein
MRMVCMCNKSLQATAQQTLMTLCKTAHIHQHLQKRAAI